MWYYVNVTLKESARDIIPPPVGRRYDRHTYIGAAVSSQYEEGFRYQGGAVIVAVDAAGNNLGCA